MMTGTQIKAAVYNLTKDRGWEEDSVDADNLIVDWMMLALEEFPPEAGIGTSITLTGVVAGVPEELPDDFSAVAYYESEDSGDTVRYDASDLIFTADSMVVYPIDILVGSLYYYPIPVFDDVSSDIPINTMFHTAIIYFFYAQYYYQSGEGDYEEHKMADNYLARFERLKEKKLYTLMNKAPDGDPIRTTDELPRRSRGLRDSIGSDYYE
jgi:hypothetical protein